MLQYAKIYTLYLWGDLIEKACSYRFRFKFGENEHI